MLLAVCDADYTFTMVDVGAYGSQSDGGILKNSLFGQRMEQDDLNFPKADYLPGTNIKMEYFVVGDEAFPLKPYIMRPYPEKNLPDIKRIFNFRLSRARHIIENSIGIMVARWRILMGNTNAKVENVDKFVMAIVCLHNYCLRMNEVEENGYCPPGFADEGEKENGEWREEGAILKSVGRQGSNMARQDVCISRDTLANYLSAEGALPWQNDFINKGLLLK